MKQILTRLLIFAICCIMCIHTFSICTRSVIYILLAIILAFGTMLIADRLSPTAPVLIHVGIFILLLSEQTTGLFYCTHRSSFHHSGICKTSDGYFTSDRCSLSVQHIIRISDYSAYHPSSTDEAPYRYIGDKRTSGKGTNPYDPEGTG